MAADSKLVSAETLKSNYTAAYGGKKRLDISPKVRIFWT